MAILTTIDGIPLFSTLQEALSWGSGRGLTGSHTHVYNGQTGYMAGSSHTKAVSSGVETPRISGTSGNRSQNYSNRY